MLEEYSEIYDIECSIEDLGWETKEEAIDFIMTTMNIKAITLELDLGTSGVKEFLLNKLLNTDIKCVATQMLAGGKVIHSKTKVHHKSQRKYNRKYNRKSHRKFHK